MKMLKSTHITVREQRCILHCVDDSKNSRNAHAPKDAGHYHKDAGKSLSGQESRLAEALKMYAQGARITSKYPYEHQLNKHVTKIAMLIMDDILTSNTDEKHPEDAEKVQKKKTEPRKWLEKSNAIHCCMWLLVFLDSLLFWEESQQQKEQEHRQNEQRSKNSNSRGRISGGSVKQQFVEILVPSHPHSISKLLACFEEEIRNQALLNLHSTKTSTTTTSSSTSESPYRPKLRSRRLQTGSLLCKGVIKPKVKIRDLDLAIILEDENGDELGSGWRSKRARRG